MFYRSLTRVDESLKIKFDKPDLPMYYEVMQKRSSKKGLDINLLAKYITDEAAGQEVINKAAKESKNPAAVFLGHLGGLKGGKARAAKLSVERRVEIAKKAAQFRWKKKTE